MENIKVHILELNMIASHEEEVLSLIPNDRLEKAKKYKVRDDYLRSIGSSYLIAKYTGSSPLKYLDGGKPIKDDVYFNVSHSGKYVMMAVSNKRYIGLDIEKIEKPLEEMKEYISSKKELDTLNTDQDFYIHWCLKEALLKCIGTGITSSLKEVPVLPYHGIKEYKDKKYFTTYYVFYNYVIAIAAEGLEEIEGDFVYEVIGQ